MRSFHWILLRIEVDAAKVEIYDLKKYPESVTDKIKEVLQRQFQLLPITPYTVSLLFISWDIYDIKYN